MSRRVVVTGLGVISAFGDDTESFWSDCLAGRAAVAPVPERWHRFATLRSSLWAPLELPDFSPWFSRVECAQLDPVTLLAGTAAARALDAAGLETEVVDRRANTRRVHGIDALRTGVFVGTGVGGAHSSMVNHAHQVLARSRERLAALREQLGDDALRAEADELLECMAHGPRFNPFVVSMLMPNAPAAYVAIKHGLRGANTACAQACASGTAAIGQAYRAIANGQVDHALAGGSEYLDDPHGSIFHGFDVCRALVRECDPPAAANRPFDAARSGFLFAQGGAAMLLLENAEHAAARGVEPICEVAGFAHSFDAHSMMNPEPQGLAMEAMLRELLAAGGIAPRDVGYLNAHGTGTQSNDACEAQVVQRVFPYGVAVNSTKSLLGHTIGASGAIEAVVTALSLRDQCLHPSLNLHDPVADLDFVTRRESRRFDFAVSQSLAFGGHNAALLLARAR